MDSLGRANISPVGFKLLPGARGCSLYLRLYYSTRTSLNVVFVKELTINITNNPRLIHAALLHPSSLRLRPSRLVTPPSINHEDVSLILECVASTQMLDGRGWLTLLANPVYVVVGEARLRPLSRAEAALLEMLVSYTKLAFFAGWDDDQALAALNSLLAGYEIISRLGDRELKLMAEEVMELAAEPASLLGYRAEA